MPVGGRHTSHERVALVLLGLVLEDHPNPRGYAEIARLVARIFEPGSGPNG